MSGPVTIWWCPHCKVSVTVHLPIPHPPRHCCPRKAHRDLPLEALPS